ncbi:DUF1304 domain-containing protein [Nocardia rosealba]|uniref:DUF1304 domain-containing protein n=1 Tax=Nocardia rosealba TaxID=2878563 RepID=UPI001CD9F413|nr:DUF1304 domain-containing protein [Nocardia rosealba]MCA2208007.1 DUF1304 domain-containing protein [Nocardia rosealba]
MTAIGLIFTGVAVLLHAYIFVMESLRWTAASTRRTFGMSAAEAESTKEMAFNQGFYNLFLAVVAATGMGFTAFGDKGIGLALVLAGAGSMVAAGVVLLASSPSKARPALIQLVPPLIGCVALVIARF